MLSVSEGTHGVLVITAALGALYAFVTMRTVIGR